MGAFAWVMMGIALWHFTIFLPDRFAAGIIGAFCGALLGSVLVAMLVNGLTVPGRHDTHLLTALEGIPGAVLGMALAYAVGVRQQRPTEVDATPSTVAH